MLRPVEGFLEGQMLEANIRRETPAGFTLLPCGPPRHIGVGCGGDRRQHPVLSPWPRKVHRGGGGVVQRKPRSELEQRVLPCSVGGAADASMYRLEHVRYRWSL